MVLFMSFTSCGFQYPAYEALVFHGTMFLEMEPFFKCFLPGETPILKKFDSAIEI